MPPTIRANGLNKRFGSQPVLMNATLTLQAGQLTTLVGPSGSGKSTLLAILAGLLRPDDGEVEVLGASLWASRMSDRERERLRRRHCGFVFQHCNLMPALTAQQQLRIALEWASDVPRGEVEQRAVTILTGLGLEQHLNSRPHEMSGGEKQRVAVARALAKDPKVIFADEPTAALDWERNGCAVFELLARAAHERRSTVLVVAHDERIASRSDQVLRIEDGRLQAA